MEREERHLLKPSTLDERRKYYREEWDVKEIPEFIRESVLKGSLVSITWEGDQMIAIEFSDLLICLGSF